MLTIQEMQEITENQTFDRKSIKIEPKTLSDVIVAFANADGGLIVIGIDDKTREIEGVNGFEEKLNEFYRVPFDFCKPTVKVDFEKYDCTDKNGNPNKVLILNVEQSSKVHANQADVVYYRVGDKTKKLSFEERIQLTYDKGDMLFENTPVVEATIDDINMDFVRDYIKLIGYTKTPLAFLYEAKPFVQKDKISTAAILLFGKNPQKFFPRARIRFIKYQGTEEKTGTQMNVIKDVVFEGTILEMLKKSIEFVGAQIKEFTRLSKYGLFETKPEYPEFVWNEIIVNAVCHRDYSIKGTDIHIKMFEDRIEAESPGTLPGLVRLNNIRNTHFSRNPQIAEFLKEYKYVKEFGEGIDRMYQEMSRLGLPDPQYSTVAFMTKVIVKNNSEFIGSLNEPINGPIKLSENEMKILNILNTDEKISKEMIAKNIGVSLSTVKRCMDSLKDKNIIIRIGSNKGGYWKVNL